jgi:ectoine hydroxylase-related dioxygenase (phytanoyl-CoA dioxygenase family)
MKFKNLSYETAIAGDFGTEVAEKWSKWKEHETRRKENFPIEIDENVLSITNEIHDKGYVILKDFFDIDMLKELNDETQSYIKTGKNQKEMAGSGVGVEDEIRNTCLWTTIDQPLYKVNSLFDIAFHDDLVTLASHYFGCLPYFGTCNLRKSFVNDLNEDHTQIYHQDPNSPNFIKMFMYLNDVDERGGPFCIVEESHRLKFEGCYDKYRWSTEEINSIYGEDKVKYLTANVGDLIIANTTAFHRGTKPESSDRTMITLDWVIHPEFFSKPEFQIRKDKFEAMPEWKKPVADYLIKV